MGRLLVWSVLWPLPAAASWPTSPLVNLPVCATIDQQVPAGIASDGSGGAFITWSDSRLGAGNADVYVQRVLAAGTVDPAWPLNGQDLCTAPGDQLAPAIVSDGGLPVGGGSGAIVAWQDLRTGTTYDVYAQHVLAGGIADPAWPRNGRAVCTAAGNQGNVSLVSDNAGGALVIWRDFRAGTTQAVFAQHVLANGAVDPAWPVNGRLLVTQPNTFNRPTRIPTLADGHGGAIVVWENWNGGATADLAAQHVRANGTLDPAWPAAGRVQCDQQPAGSVHRRGSPRRGDRVLGRCARGVGGHLRPARGRRRHARPGLARGRPAPVRRGRRPGDAGGGDGRERWRAGRVGRRPLG
jgi:hypothetical protein